MRDRGGQMAYRRIMEEARRLFHSYLSDPPEDLWERAYTLGRLNGMAEAAERAIGLDAAPDGKTHGEGRKTRQRRSSCVCGGDCKEDGHA